MIQSMFGNLQKNVAPGMYQGTHTPLSTIISDINNITADQQSYILPLVLGYSPTTSAGLSYLSVANNANAVYVSTQNTVPELQAKYGLAFQDIANAAFVGNKMFTADNSTLYSAINAAITNYSQALSNAMSKEITTQTNNLNMLATAMNTMLSQLQAQGLSDVQSASGLVTQINSQSSAWQSSLSSQGQAEASVNLSLPSTFRSSVTAAQSNMNSAVQKVAGQANMAAITSAVDTQENNQIGAFSNFVQNTINSLNQSISTYLSNDQQNWNNFEYQRTLNLMAQLNSTAATVTQNIAALSGNITYVLGALGNVSAAYVGNVNNMSVADQQVIGAALSGFVTSQNAIVSQFATSVSNQVANVQASMNSSIANLINSGAMSTVLAPLMNALISVGSQIGQATSSMRAQIQSNYQAIQGVIANLAAATGQSPQAFMAMLQNMYANLQSMAGRNFGTDVSSGAAGAMSNQTSVFSAAAQKLVDNAAAATSNFTSVQNDAANNFALLTSGLSGLSTSVHSVDMDMFMSSLNAQQGGVTGSSSQVSGTAGQTHGILSGAVRGANQAVISSSANANTAGNNAANLGDDTVNKFGAVVQQAIASYGQAAAGAGNTYTGQAGSIAGGASNDVDQYESSKQKLEADSQRTLNQAYQQAQQSGNTALALAAQLISAAQNSMDSTGNAVDASTKALASATQAASSAIPGVESGLMTSIASGSQQLRDQVNGWNQRLSDAISTATSQNQALLSAAGTVGSMGQTSSAALQQLAAEKWAFGNVSSTYGVNVQALLGATQEMAAELTAAYHDDVQQLQTYNASNVAAMTDMTNQLASFQTTLNSDVSNIFVATSGAFGQSVDSLVSVLAGGQGTDGANITGLSTDAGQAVASLIGNYSTEVSQEITNLTSTLQDMPQSHVDTFNSLVDQVAGAGTVVGTAAGNGNTAAGAVGGQLNSVATSIASGGGNTGDSVTTAVQHTLQQMQNSNSDMEFQTSLMGQAVSALMSNASQVLNSSAISTDMLQSVNSANSQSLADMADSVAANLATSHALIQSAISDALANMTASNTDFQSFISDPAQLTSAIAALQMAIGNVLSQWDLDVQSSMSSLNGVQSTVTSAMGSQVVGLNATMNSMENSMALSQTDMMAFVNTLLQAIADQVNFNDQVTAQYGDTSTWLNAIQNANTTVVPTIVDMVTTEGVQESGNDDLITSSTTLTGVLNQIKAQIAQAQATGQSMVQIHSKSS